MFSELKYVSSLRTSLKYNKFPSDNLLQKKKSYVKSAFLQQEYDVIYSRLIVLGENVSRQNDSVDKTYRRPYCIRCIPTPHDKSDYENKSIGKINLSIQQ
jgi:hypothetical protein